MISARVDGEEAATARELRHPRLTLAALWLVVFSVTSQTMILAPILPRISEQLGVPEGRLGLLVAGYAVAVASVALVAGPVSDRWGRRRMLLAGAGVMTVGLALHAVAEGFGALLAVRAFTGAGGGLLTGATAAYVGDAFPPERRGWANGWTMSGMAVGQVVAIPLGTLMAAGTGFRAPFVAFAATMALAFAGVWLWVPQPGVARYRGAVGPAAALRRYARMLRRSEVAAAVVAFFAVFLATSLYVLYLPVWLEGARGATPRQVALLFALGGLATVLAGPWAGRLSDRVGRKRLVVACSVGLAAGMPATTLLVGEVWVAFPIFTVVTGLFAARASPFQALLAEIVPDEERGSLMSLSMAMGQGGSGIGGAIAGSAYGASGYLSNTLLAAAVALGMALLVWRYLPETGPAAEGSGDAGDSGRGSG